MSIDRYKKQFSFETSKIPEGVVTFTCDDSNFGLVRLTCEDEEQIHANAENIVRMLQKAHEIGLNQGIRLMPSELDDLPPE